MDHTPGQGQFRDPEDLKKFTIQIYGKKEKDIDEFIDRTLEYQTMIDWQKLRSVSLNAKKKGIRLASHDDDTNDKIETLVNCRGVVSEFPINIETAIYAVQQGLHVCVGAPNIVRGKSHSNNMRAIDAINRNAADIICSDYLPSAMLPAVFSLTKEGISLTHAVKMVTLNPAKALGIDCDIGTLEEGKQADLLIFELHQDYPVVLKTITGGRVVYQADYNISNLEGVENVC
jgi:alpha-D-ribose 1-methylphosphonate 5-triphosphate diphosphatase